MNVYLVLLEGGGDLEAKIVDEETFAWITSPTMPEGLNQASSIEDPEVPPSQINKRAAHDALDADDASWGIKTEPVRITRGSWDNDRALQAFSADGYETYLEARDAFAAVKAKGDEIVDEYHGCIY